jgi:hypothetical protein
MSCISFPARRSTAQTRPQTPPRSTLTSAVVTVSGFIDGHPQFSIAYETADGKKFSGKWDSRRPLLSANSKLKKSIRRYRAIGLAMAPWKFAGGGNLCGAASAGCVAACNGLWSGMNVTTSTRFALIGRARLYLEFREMFLRKLLAELKNFDSLCQRTGRISAVRLNVSTDIPFEKIAPQIFTTFKRLRFYDYTAYAATIRGSLPENYTLSHSWKESTDFAFVSAAIAAGRNIVVPFDSAYAPARKLYGALPETVVFRCNATGREIVVRCINGDAHDIRLPETDGRGVVVALHGKSGRSKVSAAVESGFMRHHAEGGILRQKTIHVGRVIIPC